MYFQAEYDSMFSSADSITLIFIIICYFQSNYVLLTILYFLNIYFDQYVTLCQVVATIEFIKNVCFI